MAQNPFPNPVLVPSLLWESFPGYPVGFCLPSAQSGKKHTLHSQCKCASSPTLIKFKGKMGDSHSDGYNFQIGIANISKAQREGTSYLRNPSKGDVFRKREIP